MTSGGGLISQINMRLSSDAAFAQQIREMHGASVPLLDMVDQLGLAGEMSDAVRAIVQRLSATDVSAIRQATLDMLDRGGTDMPVDCNLAQNDIDNGAPVDVSVIDSAGTAVIVVRAPT
jgi:hypothetical protein